MSVTAAEEIRAGTTVATVLLELDGIFALQGEQRIKEWHRRFFMTPPRPQLYASLALAKAL